MNDNTRIDVSGSFHDYDELFFANDGIELLRKWLGKNESDSSRVPAGVRLGPPVSRPSKIVCVGLNYSEHAGESQMEVPKEPVIFLKAPSSLSGPYDPVVIPRCGKKVDWEVELAVVIAKKATYVKNEHATEHVAGYLLLNDYSERVFQLERGGQWVKGKSADTFAPVRPFLATREEIPDAKALNIWLKVNGEVRQKSNTAYMIFDVPDSRDVHQPVRTERPLSCGVIAKLLNSVTLTFVLSTSDTCLPMDTAAKVSVMRSIDIQSTQDSVVKAIQSAIFSGELKMGQRIMEEELAETFHISRATVREALRRLEQVGLVQIKPRRGTFVTRLTLKEVERTCRLRAALEGLAARYASERLTENDWQKVKQLVGEMKAAADNGELSAFLILDRKFHELIWTLAEDDQLEYILRFLSTPYFAFIASVSTLLLSDVSKVFKAHEKYLNALRTGEPEQVQKKVQDIHESLTAGFMADIRRAQAAMPGQIFKLEDGD